MARVVVVGGGLAGCAAALALADAGCQVTLVEKRATLGGRAAGFRASGWPEPLDNCQHVLMGCCTNQRAYYDRLGLADQIDWHNRVPLLDRDGQRGEFAAWPLPAPAHLLPSLAALPGLSVLDRALLGLALARLALHRPSAPALSAQSFEAWLGRLTTRRLDEGFWRSMLISVLNAEANQVSAAYARMFFVDGLMRHPDGFRLGVPRVGLHRLHHELTAARLEDHGVALRLGSLARIELDLAGRRALGVRLPAETIGSDAVVLAVQWHQLGAGAGRLGSSWRTASPLTPAPLVGVHLGYDQPVWPEPVLGLLRQDVDWVMASDAGRHLSVVVSAAASWCGLNKAQMVARALAALRRIDPGLPDPVRTAACRELRATFVPGPGVDASRPPTTTPIAGLALAGEWTATGWPSTMEGAVRSGFGAADSLLLQLGSDSTNHQPDLPANGLMWWLTH